jgi:serine/threonine protein kinase
MATIFGRFEIQSQISKSDTCVIYKALDLKTNQTVALKSLSLAPLGDHSQAFVETLIAEGETTQDLTHPNVAVLYGAGEVEGQFCAAMEYIHGNSIATLLARKEAFSFWDLLDICRQTSSALGYAGSTGVAHSSLEPGKIMVQWDGAVKVLGFGISNMSLIRAEAGEGLGPLMPYCSPEQIRGEAIDFRSNLFTLGAILYEMLTGHKAFSAEDPVALVGQIENEMPPAPQSLNSKAHPGVCAAIMKALAKEPGERYQTALAMVEDLEKCKETAAKPAPEPRKTSSAPTPKIDAAARAAAAAKFVSAEKQSAPPAVRNTAPGNVAPPPPALEVERFTQEATDVPMAAAAAAGASPSLSAAGVEPASKPSASRFAFDPMMANDRSSGAAKTSFSDLDELPPLKEPVYVPPPPPEPLEASPAAKFEPQQKEPKPEPRKLAQSALREISSIPPRLLLLSTCGALLVIGAIAVTLFFRSYSADDTSTSAPHPVKTGTATPQAQPAAQQPAATNVPAARNPFAVPAAPPEARTTETRTPAAHAAPRHLAKVKPEPPPAAPAAPVVVPGQVLVDSNPPGASFQLDGKSDPAWITPFAVTGVTPGKHIVAITKSGYNTEIRSLDIASGGKSSVAVHLAPINALVVVNSTPAGAQITLDGRPTGRVTPAQFAVEKGQHSVLLKKEGFLDETTTADLGPGQNFQYAPELRPLGNAEAIRTVGKFNKLFSRVGESTAGMGAVSIHTNPRGAQVAINQHMLDKLSPVEVMMGPGNYVVDITMTGFKPVHKVIVVERDGKVAIDEILNRE